MIIKIKKLFVFGAVFSVMVLALGALPLAHAQLAGVTLPSVPTGVAATIMSPSQVSISWGASSESSGTIEDYTVYRNGVAITTTPGISFTDTSLLPGGYSYTVSAIDASGIASAQSSPASVTLIKDTTPPSAPTGVIVASSTFTGTSYATTTLTISWNASTDNVGVVGYFVYRNNIQLGSGTSTAITGTSATDTVSVGTYTYTVAAYDASQNLSSRSAPAVATVGVDNLPPTTPTNLAVAQTLPTSVMLSWATSTDPSGSGQPASGVAGYQIFRNGVQVASATGSPFVDSNLSVGTTYTYAVAAYDGIGNVSGRSTSLSVAVQPYSGPSVPNGLYATMVGTSTVNLSWNPSADAVLVTGYTVYRNNVSVGSSSSTSYMDQGVSPGAYEYSVSANDADASSSATSSILRFVVPVPPTVAPSVTSTPIVVTASSSPVSPLIVNTSSTVIPSVPIVPVLSGSTTFTQFLYFGLNGAQVQALQSLLAGQGYLASANTTGFFGSLTQAALQKFQCAENIVCTGGAGWGTVGPKTRGVLNTLEGSNASASSSMPSTSVSSLAAELQALEAELATLEQQAASSTNQ